MESSWRKRIACKGIFSKLFVDAPDLIILNRFDMPTERKHASAQTAEVSLIENPGCPRFEVDAYRLDGGFILFATDDERAAEAAFLRATLTL